MAGTRIPPVPSSITGPLASYLGEVARRLNNEAYISRFSGTNPNVSAITGIPGDLVVNVGVTSSGSRLWNKSGTTRLSSTTGWTQFGAASSSAGSWSIVLKPSDQNRASTTSTTPDSALSIPMVAGSYVIRGTILLGTGNATMDYKFRYDVYGGYGGSVGALRYQPAGAAAGTDNETTVTASGLPGDISVTAATSGTAYVKFDALVAMSSAGTFVFAWAQNTSDAANLTVYKGSYLEYLLQ